MNPQDLIITVSPQNNGYTFRFDPPSEQTLAQHFKPTFIPASLFLSNEHHLPFSQYCQTRWLPILTLISNLSLQDFQRFDRLLFQTQHPPQTLITIPLKAALTNPILTHGATI